MTATVGNSTVVPVNNLMDSRHSHSFCVAISTCHYGLLRPACLCICSTLRKTCAPPANDSVGRQRPSGVEEAACLQLRGMILRPRPHHEKQPSDYLRKVLTPKGRVGLERPVRPTPKGSRSGPDRPCLAPRNRVDSGELSHQKVTWDHRTDVLGGNPLYTSVPPTPHLERTQHRRRPTPPPPTTPSVHST